MMNSKTSYMEGSWDDVRVPELDSHTQSQPLLGSDTLLVTDEIMLTVVTSYVDLNDHSQYILSLTVLPAAY